MQELKIALRETDRLIQEASTLRCTVNNIFEEYVVQAAGLDEVNGQDTFAKALTGRLQQARAMIDSLDSGAGKIGQPSHAISAQLARDANACPMPLF